MALLRAAIRRVAFHKPLVKKRVPINPCVLWSAAALRESMPP